MKELSIEEKAKAYDEAIERAKTLQKTCDSQAVVGWCEYIIPELKESEDERIRKMIINHLAKERGSLSNEEAAEAIAWLEKQGEKKPANNVEPKFKVGNWITNGDYTWKIVEVKPLDYILQSQDGNIVDDTISHVDEQFHSFTIQDAKNGNVLASELCDTIMLYKGIRDNNVQFYCDYDFSDIDVPGDRFAINNGQHYGSVDDSNDWHPATKEQRDTLMKAMSDAGYTFDFEKKELKKNEQEFAEWNEEDKKRINRISDFIWKNRKGDTDEIYQQEQDVNWLKSLRPHKQWNPTKEQMDALLFVVQHYTPKVTDKIAWDSLKTLELMYYEIKQ